MAPRNGRAAHDGKEAEGAGALGDDLGVRHGEGPGKAFVGRRPRFHQGLGKADDDHRRQGEYRQGNRPSRGTTPHREPSGGESQHGDGFDTNLDRGKEQRRDDGRGANTGPNQVAPIDTADAFACVTHG